MFFLLKKFIAVLTIGLLIFPFELNQTEAASTTLSKTVEFFIGQESMVHTVNGEQFSFNFDNVNFPETPTVKSAIIEINGISYNNSGDQTITVELKQGTEGSIAGTDYILGATTKPKPFTIKYDAWQGGAGPMSNIVLPNTAYEYTLYLKGASAGGAISFSIASAKLTITYNSSSSGSDFLKKTNFFISQEKIMIPSDSEIKRDFSISISESSPEARSVFVEVSGIAKGSGTNNTIQLSVVKEGLPIYNTYYIDLSLLPANSKFIARYDMTALVDPADFPVGNYSLYIKNSFDTYILGAKAIITYKYSVITGNLPAKGELISSTFDTGADGGAAYNSLTWKGNLNGGFTGQVSLQIAASNSITGPWLFEGPDCTSGSIYITDADTPIPIETDCAPSHNNKRYFRYKVIICSAVDCATSGSINPQVDEVVVNWSP